MIEVSNLTKRYGRTTAVHELSFTVRPGHVTGFLGPNGAGKSTTLRMLLGLHAPTSGTATVDGHDCRTLRRALRRVGALLDAGDVHGGRTARDHLRFLARSNAIPTGRVAEVLRMVGLGGAADRRIGGFSLGMRQRLGIAAALLGDPPVLLFDEPLNGLDPEGVLFVRGLFKSLAAQGRTVFVSSHLMAEMEHTADRLVVVGRGRLLADETVEEFATRGAPRRVDVRSADPAALAAALTAEGVRLTQAPDGLLTVESVPASRVAEIAAAHGVLLHELTTRTGSLERAFMELTGASVEYAAGERASAGERA
ncbi:ABC transporter ATP-binding protein [Streptomyces odontomachi]|uniref:ABC transporter ATP-binding protein n=1 Tax=Streptomyces odontomachi TaxID=2944940 RepID=UPI00210C406A|nr:ATP-binding cassette domain-containing protein [Streptomyces sp. ODS25]